MAVNRACYCTRQDVMSATDIKQTQDFIRHVDSAVEAAADEAERLTQRRFWNKIETVRRDWPNFQRAYPWRIWMDAKELADVTATVPVVTTGTIVIPAAAVFWGPWSEDAPPYTWLELDRSQSYAFGNSATPQRDVSILANFGYWTQTRTGGTITASCNASVTTVSVSDSYSVGVGDVIIVDSESMLVRDMAWSDSGLALVSGGTTDSSSDNVLTLSGSGILAGEVIQLDSEWMLVVSVSPASASVVTVIRAYNGSVLATHSTPEVYAQRSCTVARGFGGTTAASHTSPAAVSVQLIPSEVHEYAIAEALNYVYQKTSAYARTIGENQTIVPGGSLPDLRKRLEGSRYTRKARQRVI